MQIEIPQNVRLILSTLRENGFEAYAVGGCVRDSLMGRTPKDWDITTVAKPEQVKALFKNTYDTGIEHGTVSVRFGIEIYEVTTYRIDGTYTDHRRPDHVEFTASLTEDLKRRDFTMNAMAYDPEDGLIDLFDGQKDIANGVIRAVGNPEERFEEDALRMVRAYRFAARYGFTIEKTSEQAIFHKAALLSKVSAERIRDEVNQILMSDHPRMLGKVVESGLMQYIIPEFLETVGCTQHSKYHCYPVDEHTYHVVEAIPVDSDFLLILRWAALLHDIAKPRCKTIDNDGTEHFPNHGSVGAEMVNTILRRLRFDNESRSLIVLLTRLHDENVPVDECSMRHFLSTIPSGVYPLLLTLQEADARAKRQEYLTQSLERLEQGRRLYQKILEEHQPIRLSDLAINGRELMKMGFPKGKTIGNVLDALLCQVLEHPEVNRREILLEIAHRLQEQVGDGRE